MEYFESQMDTSGEWSEIGTPIATPPWPGPAPRQDEGGFRFPGMQRKGPIAGLVPPDLSTLVGQLDAELKQGRPGAIGFQYQGSGSLGAPVGGLSGSLGAPVGLDFSGSLGAPVGFGMSGSLGAPGGLPIPPPPQMPPPIPGPSPLAVVPPPPIAAPEPDDAVNPADLVASPTVHSLRRREEMEARRNIPAGTPPLTSPAAGFTFAQPGPFPASPRLGLGLNAAGPWVSPRLGNSLLSPPGSPAPSFVPPALRGMPPFPMSGSVQAPLGGGPAPMPGSFRAPFMPPVSPPTSPMAPMAPSWASFGRPSSPQRQASPGRAMSPQPTPASFSRQQLANKAREAVFAGAVVPETPAALKRPWERPRQRSSIEQGSTRLGSPSTSRPSFDVRSPSPRVMSARMPAPQPQAQPQIATSIAVATAAVPRWCEAPSTAVVTSAVAATAPFTATSGSCAAPVAFPAATSGSCAAPVVATSGSYVAAPPVATASGSCVAAAPVAATSGSPVTAAEVVFASATSGSCVAPAPVPAASGSCVTAAPGTTFAVASDQQQRGQKGNIWSWKATMVPALNQLMAEAPARGATSPTRRARAGASSRAAAASPSPPRFSSALGSLGVPMSGLNGKVGPARSSRRPSGPAATPMSPGRAVSHPVVLGGAIPTKDPAQSVAVAEPGWVACTLGQRSLSPPRAAATSSPDSYGVGSGYIFA